MNAKDWTKLIAALIWGCQSSASASVPPFPLSSQDIEIERPKTFQQPVNFIPGPAIQPSAQLLDWLNQQAKTVSGSRKQFRLPVFIHFDDPYQLAIADSFIGTSEQDRDHNTIFLSLNDSFMGIPLLERLTDICATSATSCVVWLEGYWGTSLPELSDLREEQDNKWPFTVLKVHGLVTEQAEPNQEITVFIGLSSP